MTDQSGLIEKLHERFTSQFRIAQYPAQETWANTLASVYRDGHDLATWVPHADMATPLPSDLETCSFQGMYRLA